MLNIWSKIFKVQYCNVFAGFLFSELKHCCCLLKCSHKDVHIQRILCGVRLLEFGSSRLLRRTNRASQVLTTRNLLESCDRFTCSTTATPAKHRRGPFEISLVGARQRETCSALSMPETLITLFIDSKYTLSYFGKFIFYKTLRILRFLKSHELVWS